MTDMQRWRSRPSLIAAAAFVGGVAVAAVAVTLFVLLRSDDDGDGIGDQQAVATSTAGASAGGTPEAGGTPQAGATATPGRFDDADEALLSFIQDQLLSEHVGECPDPDAVQPPSTAQGTAQGICTRELYRSDALVTVFLGEVKEPVSKFEGEAVLTRNADGFWVVNLVQPPPEGGVPIAAGGQATVYLVGDCLNFREAAGLSSAVRSCRIDGTTADVVEGPQEADGHTWWRLEGLGWASEQYLRATGE